jgi:ribosomal small subunit protein bTHX
VIAPARARFRATWLDVCANVDSLRAALFEEIDMGKGDRRTRKGKIAVRSYGNKRPHSAKKATSAAVGAKPAVKKAAAAPKKKA